MKRLIFFAVLAVSAARAGTVVISAGGWYMGTYESLDANAPAIRVETREDVYIYHSTIHSLGNGIEAWGPGSNVHVIDCYLLGNNIPGKHAIYEGIPQTFQCDMNHISGWDHGVYLNNPPYSPWTGAIINIYFNHFDHCVCAIGLYWLGGIRGQVAWNEDISAGGGGDQITFYSTSAMGGTMYPVNNNFVYGPYPVPGHEYGYTSAGIITDGDTIIPSSGMHFFDNQVIQNAAGGIGFAYSINCLAEGNTVVSGGVKGIYAAGMSVYVADATNVIQNNFAAVMNGSTGTRDDFTTQWPWGTYLNNTSLSSVDPYAEFGVWHEKIVQSGFVQIGPDW